MTMPSRTTRILLSRVILPPVTRQPATVPTLLILYTWRTCSSPRDTSRNLGASMPFMASETSLMAS